jgi:hypothetical protein
MRFGAFEVSLVAANDEAFPEIEDPQTWSRYVVAVPGRTFTIRVRHHASQDHSTGRGRDTEFMASASVDGAQLCGYRKIFGRNTYAIFRGFLAGERFGSTAYFFCGLLLPVLALIRVRA